MVVSALFLAMRFDAVPRSKPLFHYSIKRLKESEYLVDGVEVLEVGVELGLLQQLEAQLVVYIDRKYVKLYRQVLR